MPFRVFPKVFNDLKLFSFFNPKSAIQNPKSCLNGLFVQALLTPSTFRWICLTKWVKQIHLNVEGVCVYRFKCSVFREEKEWLYAARVGKSHFRENSAWAQAVLTKGSCLNTEHWNLNTAKFQRYLASFCPLILWHMHICTLFHHRNISVNCVCHTPMSSWGWHPCLHGTDTHVFLNP